MPFVRSLILQRLEGNQLVFQLPDGQEIKVEKADIVAALPEQQIPKIGSSFSLQILSAEQAAQDRDALARAILNQLLTDDQNSQTATREKD